ncbi:MFS transporter [Halomonas organivorans]|uniref:Putative MFS family arabinose efflux permease n=1 Tax=Halomonas organivorans TaxID=257772 RepID=A0A7W5BZ51_9GAMM|nr:MFS transporter [Halomonas organivorans]MBB3141851.1 putative MFS family arabinose efflux permease [Halomonas organivorans]
MSYRTLLKDHRGLLGIAFLAMFSSSLGQSFFIGLFQAPIAERLGFSAGEFGTAYSLVTLVAGFAVLRLGPSIDWVAPRRFALAILSALGIGILLLTASPWWPLGVLGLGLVRLCGQGMMSHLGNTLAGREFEALRGRALGLAGMGLMLGETLLPPLVAGLLVWLGWRELWWALAAGLAVLWGMSLWAAPWPSAPRTRPERGAASRGPRPFRDARFWRLLPLLMTLPVAMTGLFIYQAQLTSAMDSSLAVYSLALTGMGLAKLPGALLGGHWVDRLGPVRLARLYLLPFALGLVLALTQGGPLAVWALMVGGGLAMGSQESIATSLLVRLWGPENLGRVRATLSAAMVFSTGIAPAVLGVALDLGASFSLVLAGMLALLIGGWWLAQGVLRQAVA